MSTRPLNVPYVVQPAATLAAPTAPTLEAAPPSLPPAEQGATQVPSGALAIQAKPKPKINRYRMPRNGLMKKKAIAVLALRAQGMSMDEIAVELKVKKATCNQYVHIAMRNGLLETDPTKNFLTNPEDSIEFELARKAVRNLNEMLDSADPKVRETATLDLMKGTLYKKYDAPKEAPPQQNNILAIRIELPETGASPEREGSMGGVPANYIDADTDDGA